MNNRERALAVLNYEKYDRLPIVHFGFWTETLQKWRDEGHLTNEEAEKWGDGNYIDRSITKKLGFDFNWYSCYHSRTSLFPYFERKIIEVMEDGTRKVMNGNGVIILEKTGIVSIPAEVGHTLTDRESFERDYLPRLLYSENRINFQTLEALRDDTDRDIPTGIHCGSLFGEIRNWLGVEGISYLYSDDEDLYDEIINTVGDLCYRVTETVLKSGVKFDFGHFWEDICFKNGPLVRPSVFYEKVGPHYNKITKLLRDHGINIVSLDCDGQIDSLIPTWFENGVNTMFPIEVGTWAANIKPWREKYGKELRGVGGMDKKVFAYDYAAIDAEIERLKPLVELGGYIPCPDHRIAPDAKWENVQYYCDKMRKIYA
jgi:uroporphyrinogen decarboxylase